MISIVVPLYNKEKCIDRTIVSILNQTYRDFELIIVDDGSTDTSVEKVEAYKDKRIRLIRKKNGGPSSARNKGVQQAKGEWIIFLDADDEFLSDALEHFSTLILQNPFISVFCCNFYIEQNKHRHLYSYGYKKGIIKNNFYDWVRGKCMPRAGASAFKKTILLEYPFKEYLSRYEDAEFLFNVMRKYQLYRSPVPVMVYSQDTLEASKKRTDIKKDYLGYLNLEKKSYWEKIALYDLFRKAKHIYPAESKLLYGDLYCRYDLFFIYKLFDYYKKSEYGINNFWAKLFV